MASILRQIVAGPRQPHPEANLDLCYVTDNIIATSGPGASYPQLAYRNPLKDLVKFLDSQHGDQWAIWEFRAEGTGYPDSEVYNRIRHYPWPDHHPPPFGLIPLIMASMRNWLKEKDAPKSRVAVVHCKAGKGRSGSIACSYLISEEGWTPEDAMQRFTERRMRPGFGVGISIPSQRRWISYVDRWARHGKVYVERPVEITEVHVWGLRDGVKIAVEGYVDEGKVIKKFHTFHSSEKEIVKGGTRSYTGLSEAAFEMLGRNKSTRKQESSTNSSNERKSEASNNGTSAPPQDDTDHSDVVFRPSTTVALPSSDVNIDFERRNKTRYGGFTMVTSVAHVWFNAFFEGNGPERDGIPDDSGVFEIEWDAMDGIKGSSRKGTRAFDKVAVVWRAVKLSRTPSVTITEPLEGEQVPQTHAADWKDGLSITTKLEKKLGIREEEPESATVSMASSMRSNRNGTDEGNDSADEMAGVRSDVRGKDDDTSPIDASNTVHQSTSAFANRTTADTPTYPPPEAQSEKGSNGLGHAPTSKLPDGVPQPELEDGTSHPVGSIGRQKNA